MRVTSITGYVFIEQEHHLERSTRVRLAGAGPRATVANIFTRQQEHINVSMFDWDTFSLQHPSFRRASGLLDQEAFRI